MPDTSNIVRREEPHEVRRLRILIAHDGREWPAPIEYHSRIDSTNRRLKEWARVGAPDRAVVIAAEQTAGRGRHGRRWISPRGNVFLSLLVRGDWIADRMHLLPLAGGIAVAGALARFGLSPQLKWPNDVLVGDRKIAGILAEGVVGAQRSNAVALGVGVNVNLATDQVPSAMIDQLTSLLIAVGTTFDSLEVAALVLTQLAECYDAAAREETPRIIDEWRRLSSPWWGRMVEVRNGKALLRGVMEDLGPRGELILRLHDGTHHRICAGEVLSLRRASEV